MCGPRQHRHTRGGQQRLRHAAHVRREGYGAGQEHRIKETRPSVFKATVQYPLQKVAMAT